MLNLGYNEITDINVLDYMQMKKLNKLILRANEISDISVYQK